MAPQGEIPLAANVLGTIGTVLWSIQLIPQIWYNWRLKKTDGLPALMMMLWACAAVPFGVYSVVQRFAIPIQMQPQIFGALSLVTWGQIMHYYHHWRPWTAFIVTTILLVAFAGIEVLLILTLRGPYADGVEWPMLVVGILATVLLTFGLLPPYPEIWKRRGRVVGINFLFLFTDFLGAIFSLLALVAQEIFDPLGSSLYIVCIILEGGIFISHFIWRLRTRHLHTLAKSQGKSFDDLPEAAPWQLPAVSQGTEAEGCNPADGDCDTVNRRSSLAQPSPDMKGVQRILQGLRSAGRNSSTASVSRNSGATASEDSPQMSKFPAVGSHSPTRKKTSEDEAREKRTSLDVEKGLTPDVFLTPRMSPVQDFVDGVDPNRSQTDLGSAVTDEKKNSR